MRIWRIEHDCNLHHGPVMANMGDAYCNKIDFQDRPKYGTRGSTPHGDGIGVPEDDEVCGTLDHQFAYWWDVTYDWETGQSAQVAPELPKGWWVFLFEVPDEHVRRGETQVVFARSKAVEVLRTRTDFPKTTTIKGFFR